MLGRGDVTGQSSSGSLNMAAQLALSPPRGRIPELPRITRIMRELRSHFFFRSDVFRISRLVCRSRGETKKSESSSEPARLYEQN